MTEDKKPMERVRSDDREKARLEMRERALRKGFDSTRVSMRVDNPDPNKVYRIFNNSDDADKQRIAEKFEMGWRPVKSIVMTDKTGDPGYPTQTGSVMEMTGSQGTRQVMMEIPRDWYENDQKRKLQETNHVEHAMKQNAGLRPEDDGFYTPDDGGIQITRNT